MKMTSMFAGFLNIVTALTACAILFSAAPASPAGFQTNSLPAGAHDMPNGADNFYKSDKVTMQKVLP